MIFVTVGGVRAFERLIKEVDRLAPKMSEKVVMQIGSTNYEPKNCEYFRFMPRNETEELYANARIIVCHAGVGSILTALKYNKPLILVPRMKKYGEHIDEHQLEIAREMESRGMAVVYDTSKLESALQNVNASPMEFKGEGNLVHRLREYLDRMEE